MSNALPDPAITEHARAVPERRALADDSASGEPRLGARGPGREAAEDCVHCGFCLATCPTWHSWQEEMDSPRGRIDLFKAVSDGRLPLSAGVVAHFDRCLGCMACVTACPSGVRYDHVIEEARVRIEQQHRRPPADAAHRAALFALFTRPALLRVAAVALWAYRVLGLRWVVHRLGLLRAFPHLARLEALAPPLRARDVLARLPRRVEARGERRLRAALVGGCVQRVFFPGVHAATLRVLSAEGVEIVVPPGQGCCGALSLHAGRDAEAKRLARDLVERFEGIDADVVVVNAAGCGSHLKDLEHLFQDEPEFAARARAFAARTRDVTEVLATLPPRARRGAIRARIAYHSPCHLGHAQRVGEAPRSLLRAIPGVELVEVPDGDQCCGSAGIYNLVQPESAGEIGCRKADAVQSTGASLLASANPGCTLHVGRILAERGASLEAAHPIEILDRAIARGAAE